MWLAAGFSVSPDFRGYIIWLDLDFFRRIALRTNYDVIGKLSLMRNPVMKLSEKDIETSSSDLRRLKERNDETGHRFHDELIGHLLGAHILDLYDIHARQQSTEEVPERSTQIMHGFISLLETGDIIIE